MAKLSFNWLLSGMKGKACSHDDVYTKTNKQTGKSSSVNANTNPNANLNPNPNGNANQGGGGTSSGGEGGLGDDF